MISVIALYALLLQAFVAAAIPVASFESLAGISCAQDGWGPQTPGDERHRRHNLCCILAWAADGCGYVAVATGVAVFPAPTASLFVWALTPAIAPRPPETCHCAARGLPQTL
ncbi:hypothetical protein [Methylocapsa aurea]|uniref:hypothetical protein n=1 Tax=Methylocapsa aurea TaxID=663610 RepID=UPI000564C685|nr:hypothetical protein [Methylocapsa aurea]